MSQVVARVEDTLLERVDALVDAGLLESRSEAVRIGLLHTVDRLERDRIGHAIVEGYTRIPQTTHEVAWADAAGRRMVEDEPW